MPREYLFTDECRARSRNKEAARRERINSLPREFGREEKDTCLMAFGFCCGYCGTPETDVRLEFDHYIDIWEDNCPGTVLANMVPSCRSCNRKKGNLGAATILTPEKKAEVEEILTSFGGVF